MTLDQSHDVRTVGGQKHRLRAWLYSPLCMVVGKHTQTHICIYICIHAYTSTYTSTYTYAYTSTSTYTYTSTLYICIYKYICIYIYIYIYIYISNICVLVDACVAVLLFLRKRSACMVILSTHMARIKEAGNPSSNQRSGFNTPCLMTE